MTRIILRFCQPLRLLLATLTYSLGAGMARYFGIALHPPAFILGLLSVLLLQIASSLLVEYFRPPAEPLIEGETSRQRQYLRVLLFQIAAAALVLAAAMTVVMLYTRLLNLSSGLLLALVFVLFMAYSIPPLRLIYSGYGELALAVLWAVLLPALAFILQTSKFHRLLPLVAFPLTLLALAYLLVSDFPSYAADQKYARHSLLTRLTWQRAVPLHHIILLGAYFLFATAPFFSLPWSLLWPAFLTLPLAIVQIIWLQRIALGGRTFWNFLMALATAEFGLTVYFLSLTLWIR